MLKNQFQMTLPLSASKYVYLTQLVKDKACQSLGSTVSVQGRFLILMKCYREFTMIGYNLTVSFLQIRS